MRIRGDADDEQRVDRLQLMSASDSGVDTDAERKRRHRNRGEGRILAQAAQTVADVVRPAIERSEPDVACIFTARRTLPMARGLAAAASCVVRPSRFNCAARIAR